MAESFQLVSGPDALASRFHYEARLQVPDRKLLVPMSLEFWHRPPVPGYREFFAVMDQATFGYDYSNGNPGNRIRCCSGPAYQSPFDLGQPGPRCLAEGMTVILWMFLPNDFDGYTVTLNYGLEPMRLLPEVTAQ